MSRHRPGLCLAPGPAWLWPGLAWLRPRQGLYLCAYTRNTAGAHTQKHTDSNSYGPLFFIIFKSVQKREKKNKKNGPIWVIYKQIYHVSIIHISTQRYDRKGDFRKYLRCFQICCCCCCLFFFSFSFWFHVLGISGFFLISFVWGSWSRINIEDKILKEKKNHNFMSFLLLFVVKLLLLFFLYIYLFVAFLLYLRTIQ